MFFLANVSLVFMLFSGWEHSRGFLAVLWAPFAAPDSQGSVARVRPLSRLFVHSHLNSEELMKLYVRGLNIKESLLQNVGNIALLMCT